jgi:hypothetical protein
MSGGMQVQGHRQEHCAPVCQGAKGGGARQWPARTFRQLRGRRRGRRRRRQHCSDGELGAHCGRCRHGPRRICHERDGQCGQGSREQHAHFLGTHPACAQRRVGARVGPYPDSLAPAPARRRRPFRVGRILRHGRFHRRLASLPAHRQAVRPRRSGLGRLRRTTWRRQRCRRIRPEDALQVSISIPNSIWNSVPISISISVPISVRISIDRFFARFFARFFPRLFACFFPRLFACSVPWPVPGAHNVPRIFPQFVPQFVPRQCRAVRDRTVSRVAAAA